jgi:hypothetical protein
MDNASPVGKCHIRAGEHVIGYCLTKHLHPQDISDSTEVALVAILREKTFALPSNLHFFGLALEVRMHQGHMIVAAYDISKCRQPLFDALDFDLVRDRVS